jgi:LacI family gluconate utilization system Gnt-I transcriptional repressor
MTLYLGRKGHKRIGFVCRDTQTNERARERKRGYRAALQELKIRYDPDLVVEAPLGFQEGADAMSLIMSRVPEVSAVFFAAELWAVGALLECQRRNIEVPRSLALAGFASHLSPETKPSLTSILIDRAEIGRLAAKLLLRRARGDTVADRTIDIGFSLIERESA